MTEVLSSLPLLALLAPEVRALVVDSFVPVSFEYGDVIFAEGDPGDAFYVLAEGRARVLKGTGEAEVSLNVLGPGESFGETALVTGGVRTATVRASSAVAAYRLDAGVFRALVAREPRIGSQIELAMRQQEVGDLLRLSSPFAALSRDAFGDLLQELRPVSAAAGSTVPADGLYVVESGRLRARAEGRDVAFFSIGDVVHGAGGAVVVEAVTDCSLLRLDQAAFDRLADAHPGLRDAVGSRRDYSVQARVPLDVAEAESPEVEAVGPGARPAPGPKRVKKFRHIRQVDEADCGAAALAMVCRHFGMRVSLARVRRHVGTGLDGTSLAGLARGGEELGFNTRALKVSRRNVEAVPAPAILHWGGNHWVVLLSVDAASARVADPALGVRTLSRAEFDEAWSGYAVLFERTERVDEVESSPSGFAWLRPFARAYRGPLAGAVALAMLVSGLALAFPVLSKVVVDRVLGPRDFGLLETLLLSMVAVLVVSVAASYAQRLILARAAVRMDAETLDHVAGRMLALPMRYFYARRTGDLQRRLIGMRQVRQFLVQNSVVAITSAVQLVVAVVLMFVYSRPLALVFVAAMPFYGALMRFAVRRMRPLNDALEEAFSAYHSLQVDAVKGIETVKAMGGEDALRRALVREYRGLSDRQLRVDVAGMVYDGAVQALTFVSLVAFLWFGSLEVLRGSLTVGGLVSFSALVVLANGPVVALLALWDDVQMASVLLSRLSDIFEEEPEQGDDSVRAALRPVPSLEGRVRLDGVGFRYGGPESAEILSGISFEVPAGTTAAIVGRSGSGKTTLMKLLAGLIEPTSGRVMYDGVDMRSLDYRSLRRQIGVVLQESYLFADTLAHNIAFGDVAPDMDRVVQAARVASADEFISRLPMGYETRVGETGLLLSGGQRQRIAIARAVYHSPAVLLFDEATSALDTEAERAVQENMDQLLDQRTSFVIAHRLSTVRNADVILVLDRGRLVERGTHDELMSAKGLYFYLTSQQLNL